LKTLTLIRNPALAILWRSINGLKWDLAFLGPGVFGQARRDTLVVQSEYVLQDNERLYYFLVGLAFLQVVAELALVG
jgi:hypothetical protein